MAIGVNFDKATAVRLVDSLANGKSIEGVRTVDDMLALAGACFFVAMSHGPVLPGDVDWSSLPPEYQEAREDTLYLDLHAAIEFYSHLTQLVTDGEYDEHFDAQCRAIVTASGELNRKLLPLEGMR